MLSTDPIPAVAHAPPGGAGEQSAQPTEAATTSPPPPTPNRQPPPSAEHPATSPLSHSVTSSPPPPALAPLFNLTSPLPNSAIPSLIPAFKSNRAYLDDHEQLRAYRINLALDEALLTSIQTLVDVQRSSDNDADRRRAATVIVHLFKSHSRTNRTKDAAGAAPSPSAPSSSACSAPLRERSSSGSPIPHYAYTPKPYKLKAGPISQPCDIELPPEADLKRIVGGPPHPYNLTSPLPDPLPPPPPEATPRDVVRTQLRAVHEAFSRSCKRKDEIPAIFNSLAPCLQNRGRDNLPDFLETGWNPGFRFSGMRTTIGEPVFSPIDQRTDNQPPSPTGQDLQSATVLVTRHPPPGDASCTFHLILHDPTTDPAHPQPPIWLTSHIQPNTS